MPQGENDNKRIQNLGASLERQFNIEPRDRESLGRLFEIFSLYFELITESAHINFTSLFSRIVFAGVKYNLDGRQLYLNHHFRRSCEASIMSDDEVDTLHRLGCHVLRENLKIINQVELPVFNAAPPINQFFKPREERRQFFRIIRTMVVGIEHEASGAFQLVCFHEESPHISQQVILEDIAFKRQFQKILQYTELPLSMTLVDVDVRDEKQHARAFVYLPDLLIGVTSISECFQSEGSLSISYLGKKLIPIESTIHLLKGNIVNHMLDEIIHDDDLDFKKMLPDIFALAPVQFALMDDAQLRKLIDDLQKHFDKLKSIMQDEISDTGIEKQRAYLEPSFYSNEYGIQGRLDLYHFNENSAQSDIIELKSGKLFKANGYGLNENHYVQTLLYDLMLESVHGGRIKSNNYILYSGIDEKNLRFAPRIRNKQLEALHVRNDIVFTETLLQIGDEKTISKMLGYLDPDKIPDGFNFLKRDTEKFNAYYNQLSPIEKAYVIKFIAFTGREFFNARVGEHGLFKNNGLASLWLDSIQEKLDTHRILSYLKITENHSDKDQAIIRLSFTEKSSRLSRFRTGDIAVMYPDDGTEHAVLHHQVFKCTIVELNDDSLQIRPRARQKNLEVFDRFQFWHLEADSLDSGFNRQYQSLYYFMSAPLDYRRKILCLDPPSYVQEDLLVKNTIMTERQKEVLKKAINARDYFLLWGPPGTGKTSVMMKGMVEYYFKNTNKNILLLAYTNRAVDEICASIESIDDIDYIRLGSRYSTAEQYRHRLLRLVIENVKSRKDLKSLLSEKRVFVATVSSYQGMAELMKIKQFEIAIIDEASQILEPMLVGVLAQFEKFILIGDHKQLPAVVTQPIDKSRVVDQELVENAGLQNLANSLFERLFNMCISKNWTWAYDVLEQQGRMHEHILGFISDQFYEGRLGILDKVDRLRQLPKLKAFDSLSEILINERIIFVDVPMDESITKKTNQAEAKLLVNILECWQKIYQVNEIELLDESIGVITPFRSQIALIKNLMPEPMKDHITVDTIERYQGGARNQIAISLAVSRAQLLDSISNISEDGIDRKLNVALTRARENVIIFGCKSLLERKEVYKKLISYSYNLDYKIIEKSNSI